MNTTLAVSSEESFSIAQSVLDRAMRAGASDAEVVIREGDEFSVTVRLGEVEQLKEAGSRALGLRVFLGLQSASTSSSDFSYDGIEQLVRSAVALAGVSSEDPCAALPEASAFGIHNADLDLYHPDVYALPVEERIALARRVEQAALSNDARLTNSDGGDFHAATGKRILANSRGFAAASRRSSCSLSVAPIAVQHGEMQRDYWYSAALSLSQLESPEEIGRIAAERTLRRLGARKVPTQQATVVFAPETARTLLGSIQGAVNGDTVYRNASFLAGRLGQQVAGENVTIWDDGAMPAHFGSVNFDGEGLPPRRTAVIERGVLRSYLLNSYTGRKLGMLSTANASRSLAGAPGIAGHNFYLDAGAVLPEQLIAEVSNGFYITSMMGHGANLVTGDISYGATGLWISGGELTHAVEEVTIAGNLTRMLQSISGIGADLHFRSATSAPSLRIEGLTIAGS